MAADITPLVFKHDFATVDCIPTATKDSGNKIYVYQKFCYYQNKIGTCLAEVPMWKVSSALCGRTIRLKVITACYNQFNYEQNTPDKDILSWESSCVSPPRTPWHPQPEWSNT